LFKSFLRLSAGNVLGGLTSIVVLFLLPYFYSPSQVGTYFLSLSFATLISILMSQGRDPLFISVNSDSEARKLVALNIRLLIRNLLVASLFIFVIRIVLQPLTQFNMIEVFLTIVISFVYSVFSLFFHFTLRHENFKLLSLRSPIQNVVIASLQILGSLVYPSVYMLLLCEILGRLIGCIPLIQFFMTQKTIIVKPSIYLEGNVVDIKRVSRFILFSNLIDASLMLIVLNAIHAMFGSGAMGQLSWALRICIVPISVVGISLGQIYLTTFTKFFANPSQALFKLFKKNVVVVIVFSCTIFVAFRWLLPSLLNLYSLEGWDSVSGLVQNLALFSASKFLWDALSQFYNVMRAWGQLLFASCCRILSLLVALLFISLKNLPLSQSIALTFGALAISQFVLLIYVYYEIRGLLKSR